MKLISLVFWVQPTPIFTKIELSTVEALKTQFAGRQQSVSPAKKDKSEPSTKVFDIKNADCLKQLEAAIAEQVIMRG